MVVLDLCIDLLEGYKFRNEYKVDLNVMARWILITLFENRALFIGFFYTDFCGHFNKWKIQE